MNEQIERITRMQGNLDMISDASWQLRNALRAFESARSAYGELSGYYGSNDWHNDIDIDNDNKLPEELKHDVLNGDNSFNAISEYKERCFEALEKITAILKSI